MESAAKFLKDRNIKGIKPKALRGASKELGKSLVDTLKIIAFLKSGGQGYSPFPLTTRAIKREYV